MRDRAALRQWVLHWFDAYASDAAIDELNRALDAERKRGALWGAEQMRLGAKCDDATPEDVAGLCGIAFTETPSEIAERAAQEEGEEGS